MTRSGAVGDDGVGIGAGGVGAAAEDDGLGEELDAEAGGGGEDAVHADAGRRGRAFVAAEHGFEEIGLHGLDADGCALGGEVEGGAGGSLWARSWCSRSGRCRVVGALVWVVAAS